MCPATEREFAFVAQGRSQCALRRGAGFLDARASGLSVRKTAMKFGLDASTVQRISRPFEAGAAVV
jgi:hypothetical protein